MDKKGRVTKLNLSPANIIRPFILVNMGLFIIVIIIWLQPAAASWRDARGIINRQQQVYATYQMQLQDYPMQAAQPAARVLPYEYFAITMAEIQSLARDYSLETTQFISSEPANHDSRSFIEIRVIATFAGQANKTEYFVSSIANTAAFIRNTRMEFLDDEMVNLRIEFSLFGWGE